MNDHSEPIQCPKPWVSAIEAWLGQRSYHFLGKHPSTIASTWTSIVMSHRHRNPEQSTSWRSAVDDSLRRCRATHSVLLASNETPLGTYLIQAASRARIPTVLLQVPSAKESFLEWKDRVRHFLQTKNAQDCSTQSNQSTEQHFSQLWVSPIIDSVNVDEIVDDCQADQRESAEFDSLPLVDRTLIALADCVHVISVHPKSKTERLIIKRLADQRFPAASIFVMFHRSLANEHDVKRERLSKKQVLASSPIDSTLVRLLDYGAVGWLPSLHSIQKSGDRQNSISQVDGYPRIVSSEENPTTFVPCFSLRFIKRASPQTWAHLTHCTRARMGAWPDQSQIGYYDSLFAMNDGREIRFSPLDTLKRILLQNRLIASRTLKRSNVPTVSLTEVPLQELLQRRHFQSHIGRWDWEPYGICIDRSWIEKHGGRRVVYMSPSKWRDTRPEDQPFFQPTNDDQDSVGADWEIEKEWRFVGDIHLAEIPFESAYVFVPSEREAAEISPITRFPILVLKTDSS